MMPQSRDYREYILEKVAAAAAAMASVRAALSTLVNCASWDVIHCPAGTAGAPSLDQFHSMILCVISGDTNFQPGSSVCCEIPFLPKSAKISAAIACNKEP